MRVSYKPNNFESVPNLINNYTDNLQNFADN